MTSIIVITFNNASFIDKFFKSVEPFINNQTEILFIDNNSTDGSVEKLSKSIVSHKGIKLIENQKNIGFTKALNQAIKMVKSEDILIINPDTQFKAIEIEGLIKFYNQKKPVVVGGRIVDYAGKIQNTAVLSSSFKNSLLELTNLKKLFLTNFFNNFWIKNTDKVQQVVAVSGGFAIFPKEAWKRLGGFDESFWLYLEDLDFGIRANKAGYKVWYYPKSKITHFGGGSSMKDLNKINSSAWFKSRDIYFRKHFPIWKYIIYWKISRIELGILKLMGKI